MTTFNSKLNHLSQLLICILIFCGNAFGSDAVRAKKVGGDLKAVVAVTRQISMQYQLDLLKHRRFNKDILDVLNGMSGGLRDCYVKRLNIDETIRGDLHFKLLISERMGKILKVQKAGGSLTDEIVSECLVSELKQMPMPVRKNMIGNLTFVFDYK